jgi:hypothetical protein
MATPGESFMGKSIAQASSAFVSPGGLLLPSQAVTSSCGSAFGATEFVAKPVDFDHLKEQLRQLPSAADLRKPLPIE